jgi:LPXTG-motif cell wall-anchored protein
VTEVAPLSLSPRSNEGGFEVKLKAVAAVAITTVLTTFSVAEASPPSTDPPVETQESTTTEASASVTVTVETDPVETVPEVTAADAPDQATSTVAEATTAVVSTTNPNQVERDQTVVITATVVADANTGSNTIVDEQPPQGGSQQPADIDTGDATAVGSDDENVVTQGADVVLRDQAVANVLQVALILNVGAALANAGFNTVGSSPGGSGTSGSIGSGDASATGLDIDQYITQAARENGDADTDAHTSQVAISLWMGLATANSGTNAVVGTGVSGSGGSVGSGSATATGNDSLTDIEQYAEILGVDQSTINVTQQATVLNVGFALANSGLNDVSGVAGGLLTASDDDDDEVAQELFAMLLPALLQSYGYGPAQGAINSGDATAVGNESQTFVRQVALAASSGDGVVDIVQDVLVANVGAAAANTGGNTLGSVRPLDPETANAVVTMAAFLAEMLGLVRQSANSTAIDATSQGIEIPFQGLILRLDGTFEGLDTQVSHGSAQANIRQVSIVVSLGIANANTGGNVTGSSTRHGTSVNGLLAGDAIAVLALDENGNVINAGDAGAGNSEVVVICQRLNADDVDCLAPPTTTSPPTTTTAPATTAPATTAPSSTDPGTSVPSTAGTSTTTTLAPAMGGANSPSGFGRVPAGTLPATGGTADEQVAIIGAIALLLGGVVLFVTRRRNYQ